MNEFVKLLEGKPGGGGGAAVPWKLGNGDTGASSTPPNIIK